MDPSLDWDKSFVSPSSKKQTKATLTDRATFWKSKKYRADIDCPDHVNIKTIPSSRGVEKSSRSIPLALQSEGTEKRTGTVESVCGVCCQSIDIWSESHIFCCIARRLSILIWSYCVQSGCWYCVVQQSGCLWSNLPSDMLGK